MYVGRCATDVNTVLARICEDYGVPRTCTTDRGPPYTSDSVQKMMKTYDIAHRLCSVGNPHANCRAELAVKSVKRMLRDNLTVTGQLDRVKFSRALLTYRNTPDRDTGLSPAMALFGRQLRDFLPTAPLMGSMWQTLADARETALSPRSTKQREKWSAGARELPPLQLGDWVFIQNQSGNYPKKWDKRGRVVEVKEFDQYRVMVEGSRRVTLRNRKYLRKFTPFMAKPFFGSPVPIPDSSFVEKSLPTATAQQNRAGGHHGAVGGSARGPAQGGRDRDHRLGADEGDHVRHPTSQPTPVVTPGTDQEEAGQAQTRQDQTSVTAAPSLTTPPPSEIIVSEYKEEDSPQPRMSIPARKVVVRVQAEKEEGLRRSSRTTKGKTSRFDDFEMGDG